jgi:hypothetical protein
MSTRSKSKLAAESSSKATQVPQTQGQKAKAPSRKPAHAFQSHAGENVKIKKPTKTAGKKASKAVLCTCKRGDDGSPMVYCGSCRIWCVIFGHPYLVLMCS